VKSLLPTMHMMRWALAFVSVAVSGLLGHQCGVKQERETIAEELQDQQSHLMSLEKEYEAQVAALRTQRDIADASNVSLQKTLKQLQSESLEYKSTQRLYENIEGNDRSSGLGVDTVTRVNDENGNPKELHITVVQARGRNRVKGQVGVELVGEKAGAPWREVIADVAAKSALQFDLRFFQTLVVPIPESENHIDIVEIEVKPESKRHKSVSYATDWTSIVEE